jgi:hypothetical protein
VKLTLLTYLDSQLIPFEVGSFCLDMLIIIPAALPLLEAHLILCFGDLRKLLSSVKSDHFCVFKLFTFQGVLGGSGEEEKVTWGHAWKLQGVDRFVECGAWLKIAAEIWSCAPVHVMMNLPHTRPLQSWLFTVNCIVKISQYF